MQVKKIIIGSLVTLTLTTGLAMAQGMPTVESKCLTVKQAQKVILPKMQCKDVDKINTEYYKICKGETINPQQGPLTSDQVIPVTVCEYQSQKDSKQAANFAAGGAGVLAILLLLIAEYRQVHWLKKIYELGK